MPCTRNQITATVAANLSLCREHYKLVLALPAFPPTEPGQFVQIACADLASAAGLSPEVDWSPGEGATASGELLSRQAFLRRPFSLAGRRDVFAAGSPSVELDIIYRVVGSATHFLAALAQHQRVEVLGPLGNAFALPAPNQIALLVGGGVGIPPMLYLASRLAKHRAIAFTGSLCRELLPLTAEPVSGGLIPPQYRFKEFAAYNIPTVVCTDDGSLGLPGFITQGLEQYLDGRLPDLPLPQDATPIIYTCGPEPMMKRVADIALSRNLPCQIAVERAMACGMGTCQSCCIRVKKPDPALAPLPGSTWCYRLACTDGPIFTADQLLW